MKDFNIKAEILCDHVNKWGNRFTAFRVRVPQFLLPVILRHRMLSFCIGDKPSIKDQIKKIKSNPFIPLSIKDELKQDWLQVSDNMCMHAYLLEKTGIKSNVVSRFLEPWSYIDLLIGGTEFANFFKIACGNSYSELNDLANKMLEEYVYSEPSKIQGWSGPFYSYMPPGSVEEEHKMICVARCSKIFIDEFTGSASRTSFAGWEDKEHDIKLAKNLIKERNFSPFEFCIRENPMGEFQSGNLKGFISYRATIQGESYQDINYKKLLEER